MALFRHISLMKVVLPWAGRETIAYIFPSLKPPNSLLNSSYGVNNPDSSEGFIPASSTTSKKSSKMF